MRISGLVVLGFLLLFGCSAPQQQMMRGVASSTSQTGEATVRDLWSKYAVPASWCSSLEDPAFNCSGVLLRGTTASREFHAWNPAPSAYDRNGVSFSFLRQDAKFKGLAYGYNHGFIFHARYWAPPGKDPVVVRCIFPLDAWTQDRTGDACGSRPNHLENRPCQEQGVNTAEQWLAHFRGAAGSVLGRQCGFKVHEALGTSGAEGFDAAVKAIALLGAQSFNTWSEVIVAPWEQDIGERLPLQAFFYLATPGGLAGAKDDQKDFYEQTEIWVPVIRITLPATVSAQANFQYFEGDQWTPAN
ncbi:hypothetical protein OC610_06200 [Pseudomonas sp. SAICEU22]|uniref:Halovibrin HvnA n=1 Tax=Pseudomonas agronomica TaxID=2979328 RepID=A0ABT3F5D5_9PSED|nr:hypothetical protein [Pseudomonas agronomica]MCW1243991.1 hypothetical protein [Pseudomonas agronomica]